MVAEPNDDAQDVRDESEALSRAARALSKKGAARGGRARAERLPPERRSEIASEAAKSRWNKEPALPQATHGSEETPLRIFDIEIPCYVLDNGTRVITNRGLQRSLGMAESGGAQRLADMIGRFGSKGLDDKGLPVRILNPIEFRPKHGGRSAYGYEATVLADLCDAILGARTAGLLITKFDLKLAEQAELLVRGFARVGIIALVDEATGYQYFRERQSLEKILEEFISKELLKWAKVFPDEFYREMYRLRDWIYKPNTSKRTAHAANLTVDLVYMRLAPGVLDELRRLTPRGERGRLRHKLFQRLTEDVGHARLREHLATIIGLMKAFDDWDGFYRGLERALPRHPPAELESPAAPSGE